ncbi:MFS transporter [Actinospica robiniae]|uniref:MFS transporter n=1 Tax=Actinospica robiniae TaxID=304901 RepID=UPI00041F0307|nr:MFS transporter [Actinospica robiniae]
MASESTATDTAADRDGEKQAAYRDLFAIREYRFVFAAKTQSDFGDYLARVALTFLVFGRSHSPALAAAAYSITYFPWVFAPLLSVLADRRPRRTVMVVCDAARTVLYGSLAIPGMPVAGLFAVVLVAAGFAVPFETSRSALLPDILPGDRYVLASGLGAAATQVSQLAGFAAGGMIVLAVHPTGALLIDAATFAVSALSVWSGVCHRPAAAGVESTGRGLRAAAGAMAAGARYVFRQPVLRTYLVLMWASCLFVYAFEGQAASLATQLRGGPRLGGLILAAAPAGVAIGSIALTRLLAPRRRVRLVLPLAFTACAVQTVLWTSPGPAIVVLVFFAVGLSGVYSSILNPLFVRAVDPQFRGRAMGVAVAGINLAQGIAAITAGILARAVGPADALAWFGLIGSCVPLLVLPLWRRR